MTDITVTPREIPEDAVLIDLKVEVARQAATRAYLISVLQAALFDPITDETIQQIKEAAISFPLIYSAEIAYEKKKHTLGVSYMTWDDYAHTSRPVHIMKVSTDGPSDEKYAVAADR